MKHKSPYVSDSYFYKHLSYEFTGRSYQESRRIILKEVSKNTLDASEQKFYFNPQQYKKTLAFFQKRPLLPLLAALLTNITNNIYWSYLLLSFFSYLAVICMVFYLSKQAIAPFLSIVITALFISFYPFLDWSTYFVTDTFGAFFWFVQIWLIYKFLTTHNLKVLSLYAIFLCFSLLNREQSSLLIVVLAPIIFFKQNVLQTDKKKSFLKIFIVTVIIVILFHTILILTHQPTLWDTLQYHQNTYGLTETHFSVFESLTFLIRAIVQSHNAFVIDLLHYRWWLLFCGISCIAVIYKFIRKKFSLFELIIFTSTIASYSAIFLYPVLSYRYFYPAVFGVIYFAVNFIYEIVTENPESFSIHTKKIS